MRWYEIKYNSIFGFFIWFLVNNYKIKKVECNMKSISNRYFDFKSDVYAGQGVKLGNLKYILRYFLPGVLLLITFPIFTKAVDFYIIALLLGLLSAMFIIIRDRQIKFIMFVAALFLTILSFFYFGSLQLFSAIFLIMPKYFLFFFILLKIYYDIKEFVKKELYYLPETRIIFYV